MTVGLSHAMSRHKLKFSPDKVDTMIVQAIALLDDLDKELNIYAMRVKEWYGWHFPELGKILNDNLAYARVILAMGMRSNAANADLAEILPEEIETAVKAAAEVSMGTEITREDLDNIQALAEQVKEFTEYRAQLSKYLASRMKAIAPNLTTLLGEMVGARLIAHAGSLMNLAKAPASTIQILGAEKALFRAIKTKHDTPKYGLIYHASLIGQATGKNKGKIARMLSTKTALGLRVDALSEWGAQGEGKGEEVTEEEKSAVGVQHRAKVEWLLSKMEGRPLRSKGVAIGPNGISTQAQPGRWEVKEARKYNPDADGLAGDEPAGAILPAKKKAKKDRPSGLKQLIEEVKQDTGTPSSKDTVNEGVVEGNGDFETGRSSSPASEPASLGKANKPAMAMANGSTSKAEAQSDDEDDEGKSTMLVHQSDKKERRQKRAEKAMQREENEDSSLAELALQAGLPITRYKRKLARGEIQFDSDGRPHSISKKEIKRARKKAEKAERKSAQAAEKVSQATEAAEDAQKAIVKAEKKDKKKRNEVDADGEHRKKRKRDDAGELADKKKKKKVKPEE